MKVSDSAGTKPELSVSIVIPAKNESLAIG